MAFLLHSISAFRKNEIMKVDHLAFIEVHPKTKTAATLVVKFIFWQMLNVSLDKDLPGGLELGLQNDIEFNATST